MGLEVWFREDIARSLAAVAIARDGLTREERVLLTALCAQFNLLPAEVIPPDETILEQPQLIVIGTQTLTIS